MDTKLKEDQLSENPEAFEKEFGDKFSDEEKNKLNNLSDQLNYTGGGDGKGKKGKGFFGRLTGRQKAAGGGGVAIIIAATFGLASITQGPLQIVHFSQLLQRFHMQRNEDFGDDLSSNFIRNLRNRNRGSERKHLGGIANKFADRFELRMQKESGLRSVYDSNNGRHIGYQVIDEEKAKSALDDFKEGDVPIDDKVPAYGHGADVKGGATKTDGKFINMIDTKYKTRRSTIREVTKGTKTSKIAGALGARLLIRRAAVDFHPLKNIERKAGDSLLKYYRARKDDRAKEDAEGTKPPKETVPGEGEEDKRSDDEKNAQKDAENDAKNNNADSTKKKLSIGTSAVGVLCAVHAISDQVENLKYLNIILPLIRVGTRIVATGAQVMNGSNDVNVDELGSASDDLYDKVNNSSWANARSIKAELHEDGGEEIPASAKPSRVGDNGPIFGFVDAAFAALGPIGTGACSAPGQLVLGIATGGWLDTLKSTAKSVAGSKAEKQLGVTDPGELAAEFIVKKLAGKEINVLAKGAELGNYANYGARLAANDTAIAMGGRALSALEVAELDQQQAQDIAYENSQKSIADRIFNVYDVDSVVGRATMDMPSSPGDAFVAIIRSPIKLFSSFGFLSQRAKAAEKVTYDYGFDEFGFSLEERKDPRFEDPFLNADIVEPQLKDLNEKYGKCFSLTVDPDTGDLINGDATRYEDIEKNPNCKDKSVGSDGVSTLLRYRFYNAYKVTEVTLACNEGDEDSCTQLGFGAPRGGGVAGSTETAAAGQIVGDPYTDSSSVPCAAGTTDLGPETGYTDGKPFPIHLCGLPNLPSGGEEDTGGMARVNSRVSGAWFALVNDAAKAGVKLRAFSSFRSMEHQRALCNANTNCKNGGNKTVAQPGYSSHQAGVAIDFDDIGVKNEDASSCAQRATAPSSPQWAWLRDNAGNYGFRQYMREAWHWDALQDSTRCGAT